MKGILSKILIFAAGAAIGSAVTWKIMSETRDRIIQEEVDSVKEAFSKLYSKETEELKEEEETVTPTDKDIYKSIVQDNGYVNYNKKDTEVSDVERPYVISPDEYGEYHGYDTISLTLYADGVLTDDQDEIIDNIDEIVGEDSLNHFGEYEDDSVFVRNDRLKCDYEILLDSSTYEGTHE